MNLIALITGLALAAFAVARLRVTGFEKKKWVYPLLLASFPFYYFAFAIYAGDHSALLNEIYAGLIFIAIAYAAYKLQSKLGLILLATGYIGHAAYDVVHNHIFLNNGTPVWWPEFCGAVDVLMGLYLIYLAFSLHENKQHV